MRVSSMTVLPALLLLSLATITSAEDKSFPRIISTSGESIVYVTPDEVIVSFGVEVFDENLDKARSETDRQSASLVKAIKAMGIEDNQLQTDHLQVAIQYKDNRASEGLRGYVARRGYSVTLKETKLLEKLVDTALKGGANQLMGIEFRTTHLRKHRDQARSMAIKAAREKAIALARELDCAVGKPWRITEGSANDWGDPTQNSTSNAVAQAPAGAGEESEAMPLGQIAVRAQVNVTFELVDK